MKKALLISCFSIFYLHNASSQAYKGQIELSKVPGPSQHYQQEYTFDTTLNPAAWKEQQKGLHVSFASTDVLFFRSEVPELEKESMNWQETGWKGERLNTQLLVWSPDTLKQVRVIVKDLRNAQGQSIDKSNVQVNLVRYVVSNYPYGAKDVTCGESPYKNLYLMPDRFESFERFELPAKTLRPIWISVNIPSGAAAGIYKGTIEVRTENSSSLLNVNLRVQNQLLPKPTEWKHRLDLWQNPWVVAWVNNVKPWSEEHKLLLKKHLKMYAEAGGKYITTYGVHSPWADNSYSIEETMIDWIKRKDGGWKFDYKIFDEYVQLAMSLGIDKAITVYTPVPWGFRFRYLDEKTGNYLYETWPPDSKAFKSFWNIFLTDLKKHLEQKGWFEKTYLGINENEMGQTLAAIKVIKEHSKKWKITYAGNWHKELDSLLDDYCFLYGNESDVDVVRQRAARGQTTTYYVCCNPPVPNNFVFSPPAEGRWMGWYTTAHGYDGFLRWAYDAWPADAQRDARHTFWPAGDCFMVYPGGNSCIRFEKLREGISDFEKIRILKEKAAHSQDKTVQALLQQLDQHLKTLLSEKDFDSKKIANDVMTGRKILEQLGEKLDGKIL
ncbi:MAG: glycoside hydrolase domain-containing protein [Flavisolibacter sp.]